MSDRCILNVSRIRVTPGLRQNAARHLRYIQQQEQPPDRSPRLRGLLASVGSSEGTSGRGELFDARGRADSIDRAELASFIARSWAGTRPQLYRRPDGRLADARRAAITLVLSPENAAGLDLRRMTREILAQLERDAGGIGPWLAAEHRNTEHRHVHIVLASRREVAPGRYRTVVLTRRRLQRMKDAMYLELDRQRGRETPSRAAVRLSRWLDSERGGRRWRTLPVPQLREPPGPVGPAGRALRRLALQYQIEAERAALERARERSRER